MTTASQATTRGYVSEIFCSIQGEGPYMGERQIFLRTAGCSATCYWCDTVSSKKERPTCLVHAAERHSHSNPIGVASAVDEDLRVAREVGPARTVSITGGEPLEQAGFTRAVAERLQAAGLKVYLETSGIEAVALADVLPFVDVVAMDIKLPSATGVDHWATHREFLTLSRGKDVFVKTVIDATTPFSEIEDAVATVAAVDPDIPFVLQPESVTYLKNARGSKARATLQQLLDRGSCYALEYLNDVRVIPQCHKIMKVR